MMMGRWNSSRWGCLANNLSRKVRIGHILNLRYGWGLGGTQIFLHWRSLPRWPLRGHDGRSHFGVRGQQWSTGPFGWRSRSQTGPAPDRKLAYYIVGPTGRYRNWNFLIVVLARRLHHHRHQLKILFDEIWSEKLKNETGAKFNFKRKLPKNQYMKLYQNWTLPWN